MVSYAISRLVGAKILESKIVGLMNDDEDDPDTIVQYSFVDESSYI